MWIVCLAGDPHEMSRLFSLKTKNKKTKKQKKKKNQSCRLLQLWSALLGLSDCRLYSWVRRTIICLFFFDLQAKYFTYLKATLFVQ